MKKPDFIKSSYYGNQLREIKKEMGLDSITEHSRETNLKFFFVFVSYVSQYSICII